MKKFLLLTGLLALCLSCQTPDEKAASDLAGRVAPGLRVRFRQIADTADVFELSTVRGRLLVKGNNANSMAVGLNHYLQNYCGVDVSWHAFDPVQLPPVQPAVAEPVRIRALVKDRFFLNFCTLGYTMPWWKWEDWERLIDWMALHGVTMPLAITGQEAVWQKVWQDFGLTDDEVRAYFTGPAHLPWHRMCNIDKVDGPLPQSWIDAQVALQKQILRRERSLNMTPVLPAFNGHVPEQLKALYPDAPITDIKGWAGFPKENLTHFLAPMDPLFARIQQAYLQEQTRLFGTDHIYGVDLFNEVEAPSWDPETLAAIARSAYASLTAVDPDAVWLQMAWLFHYDRVHWTPENVEAYLRAVPQDRVILLDYYIEHTPVWTTTDRFYGQPYLFCYLGNFGGNTHLCGPFHTVSERLGDVLEKGGDNLRGVGATLEGFGVNPFFYEYVLDHAWDLGQTDGQWLEKLADRRLGRPDPVAQQVWKDLTDSVYVHGAISEGPLICGRPCLEGWWHWTVIHDLYYDNATLVRAWQRLLDTPSDRDTWRFDVVTLGTQALGNHFLALRDAFTAAYRSGDLQEATRIGADMKALMADVDVLLACEPQFRMDRWVADAAAFAATPDEAAYYRRNAWHLVTTWGDHKQIKDYASRLWSGLVSAYYAPRWEMFIDEVLACMQEGRSFDQAALDGRIDAFERDLVNRAPAIACPPAGDFVALSRQALRRWFGRPLTLMTYNVGVFSKYTRDSSPGVAQVIRSVGADLVSLNELDSCNRRHAVYQARVLSDRLGGWPFHFASAFPFADGAYGNAVVSRRPLLRQDRIDLPRFDGYEPRSVAVVETEDCVFAATHLDVGSPAASLAQAKLLNDWFTERYAGSPKPVFLCGDMNATPDSETVAALSGVWECLSPDRATYPSEAPAKCIDYIFALRDAAPVSVVRSGVVDTLAGGSLEQLSDHLPVVVDLRY